MYTRFRLVSLSLLTISLLCGYFVNTIEIGSSSNNNNYENNSNNNKNNKNNNNNIKGHLKSFGESGTKTNVKQVDGFPEPTDFFSNYFLRSKPVLMKRAVKSDPVINKWTDDYLSQVSLREENRGHLFTIEPDKKENRTKIPVQMELHEFLKRYNSEEFFLVDNVPPFLTKDLTLPLPLQSLKCLLPSEPHITLMWMSSGGTKSVVHMDAVDNINCLYRGRKHLVLLNPHSIEVGSIIENIEEGYSYMDVDSVDLNHYFTLQGANFTIVDMEAGDCLYIPYNWLHQVRSTGSNLAVNQWFKHMATRDILLEANPINRDDWCHCKNTYSHHLFRKEISNEEEAKILILRNIEIEHSNAVIVFQRELHRLKLQQKMSQTPPDEADKGVSLERLKEVIRSDPDFLIHEIGTELNVDKNGEKMFMVSLEQLDSDGDGFITVSEFGQNHIKVWDDLTDRIVKTIKLRSLTDQIMELLSDE